jgi:hypothetical protein
LNKKRKKIVFIVGPGRSGTTVFSKFLGMHSACFALSEPHYFDNQIKEDDFCSCERRYSDCPFWQKILKALRESRININDFPTSQVPFYNSGDLVEKIFSNINLFAHYYFGLEFRSRKFMEQIRNEAILLETIAKNVNERIIVDASKGFVRALFIEKQLQHQFDFHYIILNRDPRSNVYSQMKTQSKISYSDNSEVILREKGASLHEAMKRWVRITRKYLLFDLIFSKKAKKVIYEQFTENPKFIFENLIAPLLHIDWEDNMLDLTSKEHHLMGGNYSRINAKYIQHAKEEWRNLTQEELKYVGKKAKRIMNWLGR